MRLCRGSHAAVRYAAMCLHKHRPLSRMCGSHMHLEQSRGVMNGAACCCVATTTRLTRAQLAQLGHERVCGPAPVNLTKEGQQFNAAYSMRATKPSSSGARQQLAAAATPCEMGRSPQNSPLAQPPRCIRFACSGNPSAGAFRHASRCSRAKVDAQVRPGHVQHVAAVAELRVRRNVI
jgi:hypothetical protein